MSSIISIHQDFFNSFKCEENPYEFLSCFPLAKNIGNLLYTRIQRGKYWRQTGCWPDEKKVLDYAKTHPGEQLSNLFRFHKIRRKIERIEQGLDLKNPSYWRSLVDSMKFFWQYIYNADVVGAVLPSSDHLAKAITRIIPKDRTAPSRRILEVGPGTGVFTRRIIKRMNPDDKLVVVEFEKVFCDQLQKDFGHIQNVTIIHGNILNFKPPEEFNYVVSGIPLNSFAPDNVNTIFNLFEKIITPGGRLAYFDYRGLPRINRWLLLLKKKFPKLKSGYMTPHTPEEFDRILRHKKEFYDRFGRTKTTVMRNVPPAQVVYHEMKDKCD